MQGIVLNGADHKSTVKATLHLEMFLLSHNSSMKNRKNKKRVPLLLHLGLIVGSWHILRMLNVFFLLYISYILGLYLLL